MGPGSIMSRPVLHTITARSHGGECGGKGGGNRETPACPLQWYRSGQFSASSLHTSLSTKTAFPAREGDAGRCWAMLHVSYRSAGDSYGLECLSVSSFQSDVAAGSLVYWHAFLMFSERKHFRCGETNISLWPKCFCRTLLRLGLCEYL